MTKPANLHDGSGVITFVPGIGILEAYGTTVPADGAKGYAKSCVFHHTDGASASDLLYVNEGDANSADFDSTHS